MALTEEIRIEIKAKADQAQKEIKETSSALGGLQKAVLAAFTGAAVIAGVKKFVNILQDAAKAAAEEELAIKRLGAALTVTGQNTSTALSDLTEFAAQMQRVTVIADDVAVGLLQTAVNMGLTSEEAKTATQQAIALSRAYGIDLNTALTGVVNVMEGNTSMLSRYIPALKGVEDATERIAILTNESNKAWAVATSEIDTAAGAQARLKNALGDTSELIGTLVNLQLTPMRQKLVEIVEAYNDIVAQSVFLKTALKDQKEGYASVDQQIAILQARLGRGGLTRNQIKGIEDEIAVLQRQSGILASNAAMRENAAAEQARAAEKAKTDEAERLRLAQERAAFEASEHADRINRAIEANDKYNQIDKQRAESTAATARAQFEWEYARAALEEENHQKRLENAINEMQVYSNYASGIGQIFSNLINAQMAGDEELTDKKKKNIIALYRMQQAANIAQVGIDTATAIIRQFKDLPFPAAIATSAIIGAIGATQIGLIAATKPPVALADGGIVMPTPGGTNALIAEAGKPEAVIPLDRLGGLGGNITVNVYGSVGSQEDVAVWVYEGINRARQMGKVA
jgi:DNA-binding winged helix-turn-helix (wHTH) protein